jgi:hypothetical protein
VVPLLTIALTAVICVSVVWFTKRHVKDAPVGFGGRMPKTSTAEHFFEKAEQCFSRSRSDRKIEVELDAMGNEFMARRLNSIRNSRSSPEVHSLPQLAAAFPVSR